MADQDEQGNTTFQEKCRNGIKKIGAWPLFAKIAVWVILALFVFYLVTKGLSGHGVLRFMAYLGSGAEPIRITTTALTMIGGIGAVGYLVIKYQERTAAQRTEQRENEQQQLARQSEQREQRAEQRAIARQQADELLDAIHLLGDDKASTRVAGVQSLVQIGQSRPEMRQRIVDILCGYLRTDRDNDGAVESTILTTLHEHLRPNGSYAPLFWKNIDLDLRNSTITEPINLSGIVCRILDMSEAHVDSNRPPNFSAAEFTETAIFSGVNCNTGMIFRLAKFGTKSKNPFRRGADFTDTILQNYRFGYARFHRAFFSNSQIINCNFYKANFLDPKFVSSKITNTIFRGANFERTTFNRALFSGRTHFISCSFEGRVSFTGCVVTNNLLFDGASFGQEGDPASVHFDDAIILGSISAEDVQNYSSWSFHSTHFLKSAKDIQTRFAGSMHNTSGHGITFANSIFDLNEEDAPNLIEDWTDRATVPILQ